MSIHDFISQNESELKTCIGRSLGHVPRTASCSCPKSGTDHYHEAPSLSREDLRGWILNDESLYNWARSEGVRI